MYKNCKNLQNAVLKGLIKEPRAYCRLCVLDEGESQYPTQTAYSRHDFTSPDHLTAVHPPR
jgi:hypothetical protein